MTTRYDPTLESILRTDLCNQEYEYTLGQSFCLDEYK
jgi:hypothetical protein